MKNMVEKEKLGRYGKFGGQYIPETLMNELEIIAAEYHKLKDDPAFQKELKDLLVNYANRPSLLYYAENMTKDLAVPKFT
ncbi:tryptophan synthase beta chain [Agrilactobacillus composti DSM 18527 = JCM 14202]|nr:tryptophan synthase beta chain [Agrilactobacillus composti DSM 18527 = JCM 14202]